MTSINDLKTWLVKQQTEVREEEEETFSVDRLELWHAVENEGGERLLVIRSISGKDADDIASSIWAAADNDAATRPNSLPQRYVVLGFDPNVFEENSQAQPEDRFAFNIKGKTNTLMFGDTDAPTEKGALGHSMRLNNNLHQMMMGMVEATAGRTIRELEKETRRREKAEGMGLQLYEKLQEALDRGQERELERAQELSRIRRSEELMQMCISMAPMILTGLFAKKLPAGSQEIARDKGVQKLLKTLNAEQVRIIMETLSQPQRVALMQLYASYRDEEEKEQAALPEVLQERGDEHGQKEEAEVKH